MTHYKNEHPHEPHNILGIIKWKLGLTKKDTFSNNSAEPPEVKKNISANFDYNNENDIKVFWIGHASFLIQLGKINILIDPVYSNYCSPLPLTELKRLQGPGIRWDNLPHIDFVLITHNHYDHLDVHVVKKLAKSCHFIIPQGLSKWFRSKGAAHMTELSWRDSITFNELEIFCCPAQHASARSPFDHNKSHWCGWLLKWKGKKVYHTGDTGYCPHFKKLGELHGPIDLSLISIGAFSPREIMKPVHNSVAEALLIHQDVQSKLSIGCHWGTFKLTDEPIMEPKRQLEEQLRESNISPDTFITLPIGGGIKV